MAYSIQSHFLDANIVVGDAVEWDNQRQKVVDYMAEVNGSPSLYTSYRVCEESEGVLVRQRRQALQAAKAVFKEFDPGKSFDPLSGIDGFLRSKFNWDDFTSTLNYIHSREQLFRDLAKLEGEVILRNHLKDIGDDFKECSREIGKIKQGNSTRVILVDNTYNDYGNIDQFEDKVAELNECIGYTPDQNVLLDADCMIVYGQVDEVAFVTLDNEHILPNASEIEDILPGVRIFDAEARELIEET